ncbi:MAG: nucleotidyltransferase family protein [Rhodospirillales bacterium]|nr:nucleotidyltransferase family protein [Rhodospirillales bacterium]
MTDDPPPPIHPRSAMLLAAGLATRMRPLTDATAKPLLHLGGRALIDHALERLRAVGVERVVVNAHWQAPRVAAHLAARAAIAPRLILREEDALLDTGGGTRAALDDLGAAPFFVLNGDAFWLDGPSPTLARLIRAFDPARHDAMLLLARTAQVHGEVGRGDFMLDPWGTPRRRLAHEIAPFLYAGVQLASPALFADMPAGPFSTNLAWDRALAAGRLGAIVHDGLWFHLSTPADLAEAEMLLAARATGETR